MENRDKKTMKLIPKELNMFENVDLTLFFIERWNLDFKNKTKPRDGIWMTIRVSHFGVIFLNDLASSRDGCLSHSGTRKI